MLSEKFKADYLNFKKQCAYQLFGHPYRSLKQRLESIVPLAVQYSEGDVYGTGDLINGFEQQVAELLGKPSALFMPSGTMAQLVAMRIWCAEKTIDTIAFHPSCHLQIHEQNSYKALHGLEAILIGDKDRVITLDDLTSINPNVAALIIELPAREIGGQLPTWDELTAISQWAKENNIALHLDGARLWSCESYYKKSYSEITALFDSVYVSFYKDLDGIAGSILLGATAFIDEARTWNRRAGGNLYSQFPYVLAAKEGLDTHVNKMKAYVEKASSIAGYFNQENEFETIPAAPPSNLFHVIIQQSASELMPKVKRWSEDNSLMLFPLPRNQGEDFCRFEILIGENAMKLTNPQWQKYIADFNSYLAEN